MRIQILSLLPTAVLASGAIQAEPPGQIRVAASPASVEVAPLPVGRDFIRLPTLEFSLAIEPVCRAGSSATSLSISLADTRLTFGAQELDGKPVLEAALSLPKAQSGPLKVHQFCRDDEGSDGSHTLLLEDAFTARLSLRCGSDDRHTIIYATQPLAIELRCRRADPAADEPDQGASFDVSAARY